MIDHVGLEVADLDATRAFYDAVFFALGGRRMIDTEHAVAYGINGPVVWLTMRGRDGGGPGGHLALQASGRVAVDAAHAAGLAGGGTDRGAPGVRPQYGRRYYAAYLTDPDGHRLEFVAR